MADSGIGVTRPQRWQVPASTGYGIANRRCYCQGQEGLQHRDPGGPRWYARPSAWTWCLSPGATLTSCGCRALSVAPSADLAL